MKLRMYGSAYNKNRPTNLIVIDCFCFKGATCRRTTRLIKNACARYLVTGWRNA